MLGWERDGKWQGCGWLRQVGEWERRGLGLFIIGINGQRIVGNVELKCEKVRDFDMTTFQMMVKKRGKLCLSFI